MIENSLTYQFSESRHTGHDVPPEAIVITLSHGTKIKYVPEAEFQGAAQEFESGQIVRVITQNWGYPGRYGVVTIVGKPYITVGGATPMYYTKDLEIIHELT